MKDNSESRGPSKPQDRGNSSQTPNDQWQMNKDRPGSPQEGQAPIKHTNAGNTGFSSGQISPSTQHSSSGKPPSGSHSGSGGTGHGSTGHDR
jgi:hypothetical protein